jgi:hypothetical protein
MQTYAREFWSLPVGPLRAYLDACTLPLQVYANVRPEDRLQFDQWSVFVRRVHTFSVLQLELKS